MALSPYARNAQAANKPINYLGNGTETRYKQTITGEQVLGKAAVELPSILAAITQQYGSTFPKNLLGKPTVEYNKAYTVGNKIYTLLQSPTGDPRSGQMALSGANVKTFRNDPYSVVIPNSVRKSFNPIRQRLAYARSRNDGGFRRPSILF